MSMTFQKPRAAREIEARARAHERGVRVRVRRPERHYTSRSQTYPNVTYHLEKSPEGWACSCEGYGYTGVCKHLAALERRSEREGWHFGKIAPIYPIVPAPRMELVDPTLYA
ncbi:MAG TPA: hypothetical protein VFI42_19300 [Thermomicrobiaceae bacterium]|nr:hypothetical protein [Thermomicrobiaceae bacterium]